MLRTCFQRLFSLTANQEQKVEEVGVWEGSEWQWRLQWRRERFEWESEMERSLLERISRTSVERYVNDTQVWGEEELEKYTVNSTYTCLVKQSRGTQQVIFYLLWKATAFPNVLITAWRALIDRIPTREALVRRGVQMESIVCVLCQIKEKSSQHLFVECMYAQRVWSLCQKWLGIMLVQNKGIKSHFESFHCTQASEKAKLGLERYLGSCYKKYLGPEKLDFAQSRSCGCRGDAPDVTTKILVLAQT